MAILMGSEGIFIESFSYSQITLPQIYVRKGEGSYICLDKGLFHCMKLLTLAMKHAALASLVRCSQQLRQQALTTASLD